jgi:hypothetical protein
MKHIAQNSIKQRDALVAHGLPKVFLKLSQMAVYRLFDVVE